MQKELPFQKEEPATIREMFSQIAQRYDVTNTILSLGLHRVWNRALAKWILRRSPGKLLDVCCGTGAIAEACFRCSLQSSVHCTCVDFCPAMLALATARLAPWCRHRHSSNYLCADAENLPLPDSHFDAATMAYGIRNIANPSAALKELIRTLRPGGQVAILELTRPKSSLLRAFHKIYLKTFVPLVGCLATRRSAAYRYLASSIQSFLDPSAVVEEMRDVGFEKIQAQSLFGGTATLFTASKPLSMNGER